MLAIEPQDETAWTDTPETRFGSYQLLEKVGEGGMGVVWRAQQEHPIRRIVAVKVVKPGGDSRQVLARFESERQALALLNHPNIATVFDAGVTPDGRPYFVMEYVAGSPITSFADQNSVPIPARLELFLQVCDGVEHAHQKGLLHRDLKPTNILVTDQDGRAVVKIIDFGVAKATGPHVRPETLETQIGVLLGTPEYMSPEQAGLTHAVVDTRTDIYSLGLVLYELMIGALPFDARELRRKAVIEMLRVIREEDPPRLTLRLTSRSDAEIREIARHRITDPPTLLRQLRGDLEWITSRALEKEPARRYPSASELRADVRRHLSHEPVMAGPPDLRYRLGKLARRHRGTAIAAGLAVAALVIGAVVSTFLWISADRARRENRERLKALHVTTGLQLATDGEDLKALPWLVRALQLEEGGPRAEELHRIRIKHILDNSPYPIRLWHHADLVGAYLGPDRTMLATWDRHGTVKVWDTRRGETVGPPLAHTTPLVDVRLWESTVVTADARGTVRLWDARTAREKLPSLTHEGGLQFVRISLPANRLVSTDVHGGIRLWALDSGRLLATLQQKHGLTIAEFLDGDHAFAVGDTGGSLLVADTRTGETLFVLPHDHEVVSVAPAGVGRLFTATSFGVLRLWNVPGATLEFESMMAMPSGISEARVAMQRPAAFACGLQGGAIVSLRRQLLPQTLSAHVNCTSLDVSGDGLLVALAYSDGGVRTWLTNSREFAFGATHTAGVLLTRFLAESRHLLSVDSAGVARVWELSAAVPEETSSNVYAYASTFSPDGRQVALAIGSTFQPYLGTASVFDAISGEAVLPPLRHGGEVRSVAFSPDGRSIATGSDNRTARFWDRPTGEPATNELALSGRLIHLQYSPDGQRLLTLEADEHGPIPASLWDTGTGRRVASLPETGAVYYAGFSPDGRLVQTVTQPAGRVQVWRASDGRPVSAATWDSFDVAAFRSNTEIVMAGAQSIEVRGLDGKIIASYPVGIRGAQDVSVTTDGRTFIVPTDAGTTHVFTLGESLVPRFPPWRLPGAPTAGALSPDNRWFVGATWRQMRVWSLQTGEPVTPERALLRLPLSASFSPAGSSFQVSGAGVRRWELQADTRSARVLEKLAQLFSGHEVTGTELAPLPIDRLIDLAKDPELAGTLTPSDGRRWRWLVANEYLAQRNWAAAESSLAVLATDAGAIWEVLSAHGHALAELGRWTESAAAFTRALARRPDSTELMYYAALARAAGGNAGAIQTECAAALQKFGATRNPDRAHWLAALCVLAAVPDDATRARVRDLARLAADVEPDLERFVSVHATALLRAKDPSRAAAVLEDVVNRPVAGERSPETLLVYALAQRALGRFRDSTATMARFDSSPLRATMPWHRRFEAEMWLGELRLRK
jgi:serine/threonine protein kinase/WD40 repeat protein